MSELRFTVRTSLVLYILFGSWKQSGRGVEAVSFMEDVSITPAQKVAIDKLRNRVLPYIVEDYMKEDIYLVRWLRATQFDIQRAERKLIENIKWRKDNNMTTIDKEDFSDIAEVYPVLKDGFDKEGRPVWIGHAGRWDIRAWVLTGHSSRHLRYLDQCLELLARQIRELQREGKNVTQVSLIVDLDQFSIVTHACVQCLYYMAGFLNSYEAHFPGMADKVFFVNATPPVQFVLELIKNAISKETRDAIRVYGTNQKQWQAILLKYIEPKYLPVEMGGTLEKD